MTIRERKAYNAGYRAALRESADWKELALHRLWDVFGIKAEIVDDHSIAIPLEGSVTPSLADKLVAKLSRETAVDLQGYTDDNLYIIEEQGEQTIKESHMRTLKELRGKVPESDPVLPTGSGSSDVRICVENVATRADEKGNVAALDLLQYLVNKKHNAAAKAVVDYLHYTIEENKWAEPDFEDFMDYDVKNGDFNDLWVNGFAQAMEDFVENFQARPKMLTSAVYEFYE